MILQVEEQETKPVPSESVRNSPRIDLDGVTSSETLKSISKRPESKSGANEVIAAYCRAYKAKFGKNPISIKLGKEQAAAKTLAMSLGVPEAIRHVEAFLEMTDSWFLKTGYKLSTLCDNVNNVGLYLERGVLVTGRLTRSAELHASNKAVADRVIAKLREEEKLADADPW